MTTMQRPKSRYQLLREQSESYVMGRWAAGKTVLKWERRDPEFAEDEVHDLSFDGTDGGWYHTPQRICRPDLGLRCPKHQAELDELIATSPKVTPIFEDEDESYYQYHDTTIDTSEQTLRQEFARKGILVVSPRPSDDGDDDPLSIVADGASDPTQYTTIDAETIGLIELEKKMYRAGDVRSIVRKGDKLQIRGYDKLPLEEQKAAAKRYLTYWKRIHADRVQPKRAEAQRQLTAKLNAEGKKATIFALYGIDSVPPEYFEMDEDPFRYTLAETDMDLHDVHTIIEPIDPDVDPLVTPLLPSEYEVRFYLRGTTLPWLGETTAYERNQTLRQALANKALHVGSYVSPSLTGDHELAESEWDLGIDFGDDDQIDPDWVKDLMPATS